MGKRKSNICISVEIKSVLIQGKAVGKGCLQEASKRSKSRLEDKHMDVLGVSKKYRCLTNSRAKPFVWILKCLSL